MKSGFPKSNTCDPTISLLLALLTEYLFFIYLWKLVKNSILPATMCKNNLVQ